MHPWHSVQMGAFRSLPLRLHFSKRQFLASWLNFSWFFTIPLVFGYWVWSIRRKKGIALKDKFAHCTIQRFAGWQCAAKLFQQIKTFPEIRRWHQIGDFVGLNTSSCQIWLYFSPSCVSYLCLILFFSDVPERISVCFRSLSFCGSYLFVLFIPCRYSCESFGLFSIICLLRVTDQIKKYFQSSNKF